ncbi:MAG: potassium-transporting ATPase subunit KdpA [Legionellales bacterium RIFCSPHIGHO2_12_FULL_37_14]|nr:MAG: potassium-transporting ATPase subunit KdpA [Legionellales bacterium RIFCSPHIGHO2_12_FULL_37_14]
MGIALLKLAVYLGILGLLIKPVGLYMARVFLHEPCGLDFILSPVEQLIYKFCTVQPKQGMHWKTYATSLLKFNFLGILLAYFLLRLQGYLPFNPQHIVGVNPIDAFNTAISFTTNTNWQVYNPETDISYLSTMLVLTVQNFLSAATGIAVLMALIRGFTKNNSESIGNFWVDLVRAVLYILLPLAFILALVLVSQGVIQNLKPAVMATPIDLSVIQGSQVLPMGPAASMVAIKQLGSNGGGFFNANSAHPFENPTPLVNLIEMLAILLLPAALCYTFGVLVKRTLNGVILLFAMFMIFVPLTILDIYFEKELNPALTQMGVAKNATSNFYPGGNMEGKETRLGVVESAIWAVATSASSNGSTNASLDSFMPLAGGIPLWLIELGEVIFGGVGLGLCGMLVMVMLTAFIAGLMVGRTPSFLGKKIEPFEMKMMVIYVLLPIILTILLTAIACVTKMGTDAILNKGPHGLTEILYAFSSMANQNGSSFAGLNASTPFYSISGAMLMLITRYAGIVAILALAGSLAQKNTHAETIGTLATTTPIFMVLLICIIIVIGALAFLPVLVLGPFIEHLRLFA